MFAGILGLPETLDNDPPHYGSVLNNCGVFLWVCLTIYIRNGPTR